MKTARDSGKDLRDIYHSRKREEMIGRQIQALIVGRYDMLRMCVYSDLANWRMIQKTTLNSLFLLHHHNLPQIQSS